MSLASRYWTARFASWPAGADSTPGYTLLLPVPGDLPVFLELALTVCHAQSADHRIETIVIPDKPTVAVDRLVQQWRSRWDGPLGIVSFPQPERTVLPRLSNPFRNYSLQFVTGLSAARGTHVILHDADLFLLEHDFLDHHYAVAVSDRLDASGVSAVWDPWFADRGRRLVATWELCVNRSWARSFPPYMHMGHDAELGGEQHSFDISLRPQALTDPARIGIGLGDETIVHFNHVIATYRRFAKSGEGTFEDTNFRLLLIAMFIELFAHEPWDYQLPRIEEMAAGLTGRQGPVAYPIGPEATAEYQLFRRKVQRFLDGSWVDASVRERVQSALHPFDHSYS